MLLGKAGRAEFPTRTVRDFRGGSALNGGQCSGESLGLDNVVAQGFVAGSIERVEVVAENQLSGRFKNTRCHWSRRSFGFVGTR